MLKLEEYNEMIKKDIKLDPVLLDTESLKTADLHGKYMAFLTDHTKELRTLNRRKKVLLRELLEYYSGRADDSVYKTKGDFDQKVLKQDLMIYVESDLEWIKLQEKIDYHEVAIQLMDATVKHINKRDYAIKNAIEWRRFSNGLN